MSELTSLPTSKKLSSRSSFSSSGSNDSNDFHFGFNLGSKFQNTNSRKSKMIGNNDFGNAFSASRDTFSEDESESNNDLTSVGRILGKKDSSEKISRKNSNNSSKSVSSNSSGPLTKLNIDLFGKKNSNTNTENTDENVSTSGFSDIDDEVGEMLGLSDFDLVSKKETKKKIKKKSSPKNEKVDAYSFDTTRSKRLNSSKRPSGFTPPDPKNETKAKKKSKQSPLSIEDDFDFDDDKLLEEQENEIIKIKEKEEKERKEQKEKMEREKEQKERKLSEEKDRNEREERELKERKENEEREKKERELKEKKEKEELEKREREEKLEREREEQEKKERKEREERELKEKKENEEREKKERELEEKKQKELEKHDREESGKREKEAREKKEREKREHENKQKRSEFEEEIIEDEDFIESDFEDSFRGSIEQPRAEETDLENFTDFEDGHMEETVEEEEVFDDDFDFSADPIEEEGRKSLSYIDPEEVPKSRQSIQAPPPTSSLRKTSSPIKLSDLSSPQRQKSLFPKNPDPIHLVPSDVKRSLVKEDLENISGLVKMELKQEFLEERSKLVAQIDDLQKSIQQQEIQIKEYMKKQLEYELKEKNLINELKQEHEEMIHRMKLNFEQEKQATVNNVRIEFETNIQKSHLKIERLNEEIRQKELKIQEDSEGFASRLQREKERADLTISTEMENLKRRNQMEIDQIHKIHEMEKMAIQQRQKEEIEEHKRILKEEYEKKMKNVQVESSLNELIKKVEVNAHSVETLHQRLYEDQMRVFKQKEDHLVVRERLIAEAEKSHQKRKEELATERGRIQVLYVEMDTNMKSIQKNYEEERLQTLKKERELEEKKKNYEKDFETKMREIYEMRERLDDDKSRFIVERQQFIVDTQEERSKLSRYQKEALAERESARIEHTARMKELFERESQINAEKKNLEEERRLIKEMKELINRERRDVEELQSMLIKEKETFYQQHEHLAQKLIQVQADSEQVALKYQEVIREKAEIEKMRNEAEALNRNYLSEKKNLKTLEKQLQDQRKMLELERLEITKSRKQIGSEKSEISAISERIRKAEMSLNEQLKFLDMTSVGEKEHDIDQDIETPPRRSSRNTLRKEKIEIQDDFSMTECDDQEIKSQPFPTEQRLFTPKIEKIREENRSSTLSGGWVSTFWDPTDSLKSDWKLKEQQKFLDHITLQKRVFSGDQGPRRENTETTPIEISPPFNSNSPSPYLHQSSSLNSQFTSLQHVDSTTIQSPDT